MGFLYLLSEDDGYAITRPFEVVHKPLPIVNILRERESWSFTTHTVPVLSEVGASFSPSFSTKTH